MLESISPYELLKRSKPKPPAAYVTDYDLYSAAQQGEPFPKTQPFPDQSMPAAVPAASLTRQTMPMHALPARPSASKTHYIADIKTRHSRAAKHTRMTQDVLFSQTPPSVNAPPT